MLRNFFETTALHSNFQPECFDGLVWQPVRIEVCHSVVHPGEVVGIGDGVGGWESRKEGQGFNPAEA